MNYRKGDLAGVKLMGQMNLKRLSRFEFFSRLQLIQHVNPLVERAYESVLRERWQSQSDDVAEERGHLWHTSFHASQFPGDDPMACGRESIYRMLDIPSDGPPSRRLHLTAEAGKAMEVDMVTVLHEYGRLISAPPTAKEQTNFTIPEAMLTGTVDSAVVMRDRPTPVEIKTKHESVISQMRMGMVGPDDKHIRQVKTQMGLVRAAQESGDMWTQYELCDRSYVYYMPRDTKYDPRDPIPTAEFLVEYDERFFKAGLERLKQWRALFDEEVLLELDPGKRTSKFGHPHGWKWSYPPCQFCSYKKACQKDFREGVTDLAETAAIDIAVKARPDYDYSAARKRVMDRWS